MIFFQFGAHFKVKYDKMTGYRPRQPAYEIFSTEYKL